MDRLYKDLISCTKKSSFESVHHENFPVSNDLEINTSLQNKIRKAQTICSLVLSLEKRGKYKVRQPLSKVMIPFQVDQKERNQ